MEAKPERRETQEREREREMKNSKETKGEGKNLRERGNSIKYHIWSCKLVNRERRKGSFENVVWEREREGAGEEWRRTSRLVSDPRLGCSGCFNRPFG